MAALMTPCPQCGAPLRWVAEAGLWNCDRCGYRAAPNAAPQPPTPPPGTYPPPMQGGHPQQPHEQSGLYPPQQQSADKTRGTTVAGERTWSYVVVPDRTGRYILRVTVPAGWEPVPDRQVTLLDGPFPTIEIKVKRKP